MINNQWGNLCNTSAHVSTRLFIYIFSFSSPKFKLKIKKEQKDRKKNEKKTESFVIIIFFFSSFTRSLHPYIDFNMTFWFELWRWRKIDSGVIKGSTVRSKHIKNYDTETICSHVTSHAFCKFEMGFFSVIDAAVVVVVVAPKRKQHKNDQTMKNV